MIPMYQLRLDRREDPQGMQAQERAARSKPRSTRKPSITLRATQGHLSGIRMKVKMARPEAKMAPQGNNLTTLPKELKTLKLRYTLETFHGARMSRPSKKGLANTEK